ncbi:MAG: DUF29 domain-containing protein, partial [Okeania sp. SIO3I5]|uniref:DUF29 family protein n=1 Tax=Okeania sp. SIO3I5 TaxID=2607805 RepID=UPI0013BA6993
GDALAIIDELEGMSKQAILRSIDSFLVRIFIHLIKNQVEKRLTNSWVASISDSLLQIKKLNLKDIKTSYYIKEDEWQPYLEDALEEAIRPASIEVQGGKLRPSQLSQMIDRIEVINTAQELLGLTYFYKLRDLPNIIDEYLAKLPGGEDWFEGLY